MFIKFSQIKKIMLIKIKTFEYLIKIQYMNFRIYKKRFKSRHFLNIKKILRFQFKFEMPFYSCCQKLLKVVCV